MLTVRSGTSLAEIESVLEEHGQTLAFEPPLFGADGSIGGTLACNQSGPARPWLGSVRDMVLGLHLINGKGEQLRFGGQVMKNVAGYDVSRLQAGAMGCLGVLLEVSLKVLPRLAMSTTLKIECECPDRAIHIMNQYSSRPFPLTGECWLDGHVYIRLQGTHNAVEEAVSTVFTEQATVKNLDSDEQFWRDLRDHQLSFFPE